MSRSFRRSSQSSRVLYTDDNPNDPAAQWWQCHHPDRLAEAHNAKVFLYPMEHAYMAGGIDHDDIDRFYHETVVGKPVADVYTCRAPCGKPRRCSHVRAPLDDPTGLAFWYFECGCSLASDGHLYLCENRHATVHRRDH